MDISIFDLFRVGIGPSSSHTVGPMRAAFAFVKTLSAQNKLTQVTKVTIDIYGSLALTGKAHGTEKGLLNGLAGWLPDEVHPDEFQNHVIQISQNKKIQLGKSHEIDFDPETDLIYHKKEVLPKHTNGLKFSAYVGTTLIAQEIYYSVGGGFIVTEAEFGQERGRSGAPFSFDTADELLKLCEQHQMSIDQLMFANEKTWADETTIRKDILNIYAVMRGCIERGCQTSGTLPGGLNVKRRAQELFQKLSSESEQQTPFDGLNDKLNWLNVFAMAVNEENAAGGRVVTAPTNGAAGVLPAVLHHYVQFNPKANDEGIIKFLLTAAAIAILYKKGASISGAEVGCQGEVGVASSMAAGALTAVLGGTVLQIENAAEIAMEHHLGMTCDPVNGLVQIPCIERNAMGAVKAVNAARLSLMGDGEHIIPLDKVIATMLQTGRDMNTIYKETSLGGLAVNIIEC